MVDSYLHKCHLCGVDDYKRYRKNRLAGLKANRLKRKNKNRPENEAA